MFYNYTDIRKNYPKAKHKLSTILKRMNKKELIFLAAFIGLDTDFYSKTKDFLISGIITRLNQ